MKKPADPDVQIDNAFKATEDWQREAKEWKELRQCNPQYTLQDQGIFDSGCSRHMTGNKSFLTDYQEINGGFVAFGGSLKGGIKREFSVARTPQQNKVAERKNRTLIEAARTIGSGPDWLFDIDLLTNSMNYEPVTAGNQTNRNAEDAVADDASKKTNEEPANEGERNGQEKDGGASNKEGYANSTNRVSTVSLSVSAIGQSFNNANDLPTDPLMPDLEDIVNLLNTGIFSGAYDDEDEGAEDNLNNLETTMNKVWILVDLPNGKRVIRTKWVFRNKKDERGIVVRNKARLVAQGYTQEEGIDYDEVFSPVARIEAIRLFLAYTSFIGCIVYQMDVKSAFLYGTIEEEVAWYETLSTNLLENRFRRGTIDKTLFIKKDKAHDAQEIPDEFYRGAHFLLRVAASRPDIMFVVCACARFQVTPKVSHLQAVKRIFRYLKGQDLFALVFEISPFDLEAFSNSDYARASLERKSTIGGCQFLGKRLISWQCLSNAVLWIQISNADYVFVDQYNMVACLERTEENVDFHQIMDFLNASTIRVGFPAHTKKVFTNMKRKGKDFSGRLTPLFASMLAPPVVEVKVQVNPLNPNQYLLLLNLELKKKILINEAVFKKWDGRVVRATTTAASLDATQASGGNTPGSDEERIEQDDLMDFVPPTPHDSPLSGGHTPGSDEGRPNINELMAICTNLSNRVLALEQSKTTQDLVIRKLKKKVRKLEKKLRERTPRITLQDCTTDPSTSTTGDIFEDKLMTIVDTLMAIRSTRPRTTVVVICNVEEEPRRATPNATVKEKTKFEREKRIARERAAEQEVKDAALIMKFEDVQARMDADALLAARLQEKESNFLLMSKLDF
ncbi:retrovirus-related pol polyprotein from transposon TNT 1-94 [Tanacetum coccineum]